MTKTSPANSPRQKYVSKICGNLESIKKQPKSVNFYNALIVKGLYFDISDCFWLFYASKYYIKPQLLTMLCFSILSCILFKNYIKPQPRALTLLIFDCLQLFCRPKTMCRALRGSRFVRFFRSYRYKYIKKIPIVAAFRAVRARPDPRNSSCRRIVCP